MKHFKYSTFELLVLIFGAGTVFALILSSPGQTPIEIIAQLLIIPILVSALHFGRKGGIVAFALASTAYLIMRIPDIIAMGLIAPIIQLLLVRVLVYGVVGIGGGIICSRIKYFFVRQERLDQIDNVTGLYSAGYLGQTIKKYVEEYERNKNLFAVVILNIDEKIFNQLKQAQSEKELRTMGLSIRNNMRAVDDVGRISHTEFGLILPNMNVSGAMSVGEGLHKSVFNYLKSKKYLTDDNPKAMVEILGYPEDKEKLQGLLKRLGVQDLVPAEKV